MAIPQHGPRHKLTNHTIKVIKYQDDFQIKATTKLTPGSHTYDQIGDVQQYWPSFLSFPLLSFFVTM